MDLSLDHGLNEKEVAKFTQIITTDKMSIAGFKSKNGNELVRFSHSHESYEFVIPLTTIPLLKHHDYFCVGEVGYCYPVNPNEIHGLEFELKSNVVSIVINKDYLNDIKDEMGYNDFLFKRKFLIPKELFDLIWEYRIKEDNNLSYKIVKSLILGGAKSFDAKGIHAAKYFVNVRESIIYLMNNYTNPNLTIEDLASHSNYSYTYFTKVFKKYMNDTPINHLNKLRLSRAKELMGDESLSLDEISMLSGYKNNSSFTEAFKRLVGINPLTYRKNFIKNINFNIFYKKMWNYWKICYNDVMGDKK